MVWLERIRLGVLALLPTRILNVDCATNHRSHGVSMEASEASCPRPKRPRPSALEAYADLRSNDPSLHASSAAQDSAVDKATVAAGGEAREPSSEETALLPAAVALHNLLARSLVGSSVHAVSGSLLHLLPEAHQEQIKQFRSASQSPVCMGAFVHYFSKHGEAVHTFFWYADKGTTVLAEAVRGAAGVPVDTSVEVGPRERHIIATFKERNFSPKVPEIDTLTRDLTELVKCAQRALVPSDVDLLESAEIDHAAWRKQGALERCAEAVNEVSTRGRIEHARLSTLLQLRQGLNPEGSRGELDDLHSTIVLSIHENMHRRCLMGVARCDESELSSWEVAAGQHDTRQGTRGFGGGMSCIGGELVGSKAAAEKTHAGNARFLATARYHEAAKDLYEVAKELQPKKPTITADLLYYEYSAFMNRQASANSCMPTALATSHAHLLTTTLCVLHSRTSRPRASSTTASCTLWRASMVRAPPTTSTRGGLTRSAR